MAVTSTSGSEQELADKKVDISNGDSKEEKIGKNCHQCRQKIKDLNATCKNLKKDRICPNKFCRKCLMNRYGEKAEEMSVLNDWNCPKCRGICNCSVCMKRRGHQPTGILVHTAKSTGFSSVSDMLRFKGPEPKVLEEGERKDEIFLETHSNKKPRVPEERSPELQEGNQDDGQKPDEVEAQPRVVTEIPLPPLPQGSELTAVSGIDLPPEDHGHALQFLEFCAAFKEILNLKEGEPEYILLELIRGGNGCRGKYSPVIRFHIILLSLIQMDLGEESPALTYKSGKSSWLHALRDWASRSWDLLEIPKLDDISLEVDEYESLGSSKRLRLLNFLCDEALCTAKLRSWMDDQNLKFVNDLKGSKERVHAAKLKENQLKLKMQDEVAKAIIAKDGAHLSASEREAVVSRIKSDVADAHAEMLEAKMMVPHEERSSAAGTEPLLVDNNGRKYWKLKGYSDGSGIFLQEVGSLDGVVCSEKWFTLDAEQAKTVEECIHSRRKRKRHLR